MKTILEMLKNGKKFH